MIHAPYGVHFLCPLHTTGVGTPIRKGDPMLNKFLCFIRLHDYRLAGTFLTCERCDKTISAYEGGEY